MAKRNDAEQMVALARYNVDKILEQKAKQPRADRALVERFNRQLAHAVMQTLCVHQVVNDGVAARCRLCKITIVSPHGKWKP